MAGREAWGGRQRWESLLHLCLLGFCLAPVSYHQLLSVGSKLRKQQKRIQDFSGTRPSPKHPVSFLSAIRLLPVPVRPGLGVYARLQAVLMGFSPEGVSQLHILRTLSGFIFDHLIQNSDHRTLLDHKFTTTIRPLPDASHIICPG